MDGNVKPLEDAPGVERFQIMTLLSLVLTTMFVTGAGAWMWLGPAFVVHLLASRLAVDSVTMAQVRLTPIRRDDQGR